MLLDKPIGVRECRKPANYPPPRLSQVMTNMLAGVDSCLPVLVDRIGHLAYQVRSAISSSSSAVAKYFTPSGAGCASSFNRWAATSTGTSFGWQFSAYATCSATSRKRLSTQHRLEFKFILGISLTRQFNPVESCWSRWSNLFTSHHDRSW